MIEQAHFFSRFGCFEVTGSSIGISSVKLVDTKPCPAGPIPSALKDCIIQLNDYFQGDRKVFELELDFGAASHFNRAVWEELYKVPYAHTTTYSAIAERINNPLAVRAVGLAARNNPIAIIVPCHRCIAKSGELQGYYYGLDMKRRLLELENPMSFARQGTLF